jgi:lysophospholipase L1-like esterase
LVLLTIALGVSLLVAELAIRIMRPGFPGLTMPQIEHRVADGHGFEMVPDQQCYTYSQPVTINAHGMRGDEIAPDKAPDEIRILCLGDSFTLGYGVADAETYPLQLEELLTQRWPKKSTRVLNAGVQGYATYHELDWLRDKGLALKPDAVVLAVYFNDLKQRPPGDYRSEYEAQLEAASQTLKHRRPWLYGLLYNSALYTLVEGAVQAERSRDMAGEMIATAQGDLGSPAWQSLSAELEAFARLASEHDFVPFVVVLPARFQIGGFAPEMNYPAHVLTLAETHGITHLDMQSKLEESLGGGADPYQAWDNHLNAQGNLLVANAVADELERLMKQDPAAPTTATPPTTTPTTATPLEGASETPTSSSPASGTPDSEAPAE